LVEAGIPILAAMNILWRQSEDKMIQIVVSHMKMQLEEGSQISVAMDDFPNVFPKVFRSLIRVGELSGALVPVLHKLTAYFDYKAQMIMRTKRATLYPVIVMVFSILVVIGMFAFVVPTFQKALIKLKVELPVLTKIVLSVSATIRSPIFIASCVVLLIAGIIAWRILKKSERGGYYIDQMMLRIPFLGNIMFVMSLSQFIRSLSILLGSGVPIMESFNVAATTVSNKKTSGDIQEVTIQIEHGVSLYDAFRKTKGFPVMLIEMIGIGESSGNLTQVLEKVTKHFDDEVDYNLNRFLTMLEPLLIVVVGVIVLITLLAIYLPVLNIWQGLMIR